MFHKIRANPTFALVWLIVHTFLVGAAAVSFTHIVDVSERLGVHDWQAYTVPFLIDGIAILGKIGRSRKFAEKTRRAGLVLMGLGGVVSLAANIEAGENVGQKAYGALLVGGFVLAEWYAGKLEAAPAPVVVEVDEETRAKRSEAARKAAATRKVNAAKAKRSRKRATVADLEEAYSLPSAPVSGAGE